MSNLKKEFCTQPNVAVRLTAEPYGFLKDLIWEEIKVRDKQSLFLFAFVNSTPGHSWDSLHIWRSFHWNSSTAFLSHTGLKHEPNSDYTLFRVCPSDWWLSFFHWVFSAKLVYSFPSKSPQGSYIEVRCGPNPWFHSSDNPTPLRLKPESLLH